MQQCSQVAPALSPSMWAPLQPLLSSVHQGAQIHVYTVCIRQTGVTEKQPRGKGALSVGCLVCTVFQGIAGRGFLLEMQSQCVALTFFL